METAREQLIEDRLKMPVLRDTAARAASAMDGFEAVTESWMAHDAQICALALGGSYYPDHVVFLGPALPTADHNEPPPVILKPGQGVYLRNGATSSQRAMTKCLSDCMSRLPEDWTAEPIGAEAEASLLNWDAEKYRQALAAR